MKLMIVGSGLPGSGKTATTEYLAIRFELERICKIDILRDVGYKRYPGHKSAKDKIDKYTLYLINDLLYISQDTIVESIFHRYHKRRELYDLAREFDYSVLVINHECDEKIAKKRIKSRPLEKNIVNPARYPRVWDDRKKDWEDIEKDLIDYPEVSLIKYNTNTNDIYYINVNPRISDFVSDVEHCLLNPKRLELLI
jgi:adenylate kinase family enzyme